MRQEDPIADNRFGLASYALTYTSYIVFGNLVDFERGAQDPADPTDPDAPVATQLEYTGDERVRGNAVTLAATLTEVEGGAIAGRDLTFAYDGAVYLATTDGRGVAQVEAPAHSGREATVRVTFDGNDDHEGATTEATIRRGNSNGGGNGGGNAGGNGGGSVAAQAAGAVVPGVAPAAWLAAFLLAAAAGLTARQWRVTRR